LQRKRGDGLFETIGRKKKESGDVEADGGDDFDFGGVDDGPQFEYDQHDHHHV
jgi:hypothetical protein